MLVVTVEMLVECVAMPRPSRVCKYVMGDPENLKMVKSVLEKLKSEAQTKYGWAGGIPPEDLAQQYEKAKAEKLPLLFLEEQLAAKDAQEDPSMLFVVMSSIQDNALPSRAAEVSARSFATTTTGYDTERFEKIKEQAAKDVFDLDNEWIYVN
jgi:hypothetical protein